MKKLFAAITAGTLLFSGGLTSINAAAAPDGGFSTAEISASEVRPVLSLSATEISYDKIPDDRIVNVTLTVSDSFKKYSTVELWTVFDDRLTVVTDKDGYPAAKAGDAVRLLKSCFRFPGYYDGKAKKLVSMNGVRMITAGTADYGLDGTLFTVPVILPENVKAGDKFTLSFFYADRSTTNNDFANSMFTNSRNDDTGKLMQAWAFTKGLKEGSITITGDSAPTLGDVNLDGKITVADAVAVLQFIANQKKYALNDQAKTNADVDGQSGITGTDASVIQKVDAGVLKVSDLPLKK